MANINCVGHGDTEGTTDGGVRHSGKQGLNLFQVDFLCEPSWLIGCVPILSPSGMAALRGRSVGLRFGALGDYATRNGLRF